METPKQQYPKNFPVVISIFVGILTIFVLYSIIASPDPFSATDLIMTLVFCFFAVFIVLHCWMARFTKNWYLFWGLPPFYGIYLSIKLFKEIKYLSIAYLSVLTGLILLLMAVPTT